jgi:hypothetical protein
LLTRLVCYPPAALEQTTEGFFGLFNALNLIDVVHLGARGRNRFEMRPRWLAWFDYPLHPSDTIT